MEDDINKPYKICDVNREKKKGIVASSLEDLISKVPEKLGLPSENLTVVLEVDGTEVDDEEYFSTLDPDTALMILHGNEKWAPNMPKCQVSLDQTDEASLGDKGQVANLVGRLQHNLCHISLLGGQDLELLSDMDPDSLADIVTDRDNRIILEHIKEASGREKGRTGSVITGTETLHLVSQDRQHLNELLGLVVPAKLVYVHGILLEKRQAQDAMELLKLYHQSVANGNEDISTPSQERV